MEIDTRELCSSLLLCQKRTVLYLYHEVQKFVHGTSFTQIAVSQSDASVSCNSRLFMIFKLIEYSTKHIGCVCHYYYFNRYLDDFT